MAVYVYLLCAVVLLLWLSVVLIFDVYLVYDCCRGGLYVLLSR